MATRSPDTDGRPHPRQGLVLHGRQPFPVAHGQNESFDDTLSFSYGGYAYDENGGPVSADVLAMPTITPAVQELKDGRDPRLATERPTT